MIAILDRGFGSGSDFDSGLYLDLDFDLEELYSERREFSVAQVVVGVFGPCLEKLTIDHHFEGGDDCQNQPPEAYLESIESRSHGPDSYLPVVVTQSSYHYETRTPLAREPDHAHSDFHVPARSGRQRHQLPDESERQLLRMDRQSYPTPLEIQYIWMVVEWTVPPSSSFL